MEAANQLTKQARILIVDDEPSARELLRQLLDDQGFAVRCASDGQSAFEQASHFDPDVVLTDLDMPRLDGIQLCERLRSLDPHLPVILLTAHDDARSILRGLRAGVDDYLTKPLDLELVLFSLRRATDRRAARIEQEQARHRTELLLEEARLAIKRSEEVLAVVAHDLRNPLGVIQLTTQRLLEEGMAVGGTARGLVESILRSIGRSNRIIENLLDEARLHGAGITLERRRHSVQDLLDDASDLRPLALQRGIALDVRPAAAERRLWCDRAKIAQVLSNLVGNAIKFSPRGSAVTVWAEDIDGGIRLAVRDQGPGITAEAAPHLFERFWQQAGRSVAGIGLGLYIAKGIVDAHGGQVWVASEGRAGSTFFVSLPAEQGVGENKSRPVDVGVVAIDQR
jgi:signal transduction histidine kinase